MATKLSTKPRRVPRPPACAEFFRCYAGWCTKTNGSAYELKTSGIASDTYIDMHACTLKEPYGVVGLIFPWNGPIFNASASGYRSMSANAEAGWRRHAAARLL